MDTSPDSALKILDSIDPSGIKSEKLFARYALYLTQARHKNYIDETSDSLISIASAYYDDHKSASQYERMLAHYYQGILLTNAHKYAPAITNLLKAENIAESLNQPLWLGRSQAGIAKVYSYIFSFSEAVKYDSLACVTFKNYGDSVNLRHRKLALAYSLNNACRSAESLPIATKLLSDAKHSGDTLFMCYTYELIAYIHYSLNNYYEAANYYRKYIELSPERLTPKLYWLYIDALWLSGEHDATGRLIDSATAKYGEKADIPFKVLYEIGDINRAYHQLNRIYEETDSALEEIILQNVHKSVDEHRIYELKEMELTHENDMMKITALIFVIIFIGVAVIIFIHHSRRERKRNNEQIMSLANELESVLSERGANNSVQDDINATAANHHAAAPQFSISRRHLDTIRVLCETYYESNQKESIKSKTARDAEREIKDFVSTPDFHSFLEHLADSENNGIMCRFRKQMPELTDKEYHIFVCSALRLPVPVILMFFDLNRNTLYTTRRRMRQKISDSQPSDEREFLSFL
ncbi:MAG: hypothetical protein K2J65_03090 [Duncaniella sp.]|nr:hypothetical protein [Duncaniella sp.]